MCTEPLFEIAGNKVNLYGVCIAIGILACIFVLYFYTKKKGVPEEVQDYTFFIAIAAIGFGFLAAKFFQAVYDWIETGVFDFYHAGITVMSGLIGGTALFLLIYFGIGKYVFKGKKKDWHKKYFNDIFLIAPLCISIAHGFGRIGCLMGGCCHGAFLGKDYVFGGIYMNTPTQGTGYFVPTQLYEALFLFALFAVLSIFYFKNSNITMPIYLIAYGVWRIFIEFLRDDHAGEMIPGLRPSQWISFLFIALGVAILVFYKQRKIPFTIEREKQGKTE